MVGDEDLVHAERHDRADGDHHHARQADGVDLADDLPVWAEALKVQADVVVLLQIEIERQRAAAELADHRGNGGAGDAHIQHKDADRVEDDVHDRAEPLRVHREDGAARTLQQALEHDLREQTQRRAAADAQIRRAIIDDVVDARLGGEEHPREERGENRADGEAHAREEHAVRRDMVGALTFASAERAAHQRVHAHGRTGGKADHQVLRRERERDGGQCLLADTGDEDAVDDVIQRLHQHRDDDGQGHVPDEF